MKKLSVLLKTESMKLRRSPILLISFFAALLTAFFVFFADPDRYASHLGWYIDELQPWSIFFLLPSITALLGSYSLPFHLRSHSPSFFSSSLFSENWCCIIRYCRFP